MADGGRSGGVQSVGRALDILEAIDAAGGEMALVEMSNVSGLPMPTIHRIVRTLADRGYLRQLPDRRYALGSRLIPLGATALIAFGSRSAPELSRIVQEFGETANLATLDSDQLVYVGQVPSPRALRMFTDLGRHVPPHCRAAGKALLAQLPDEEVLAILGRAGMPAMTDKTITDPDVMLTELARIRKNGYATEDGEMELGVTCIAVAVPSATALMSVSMSAPSSRITGAVRKRAIPFLQDVAARLASDLDSATA
ncbi:MULTISPECIES: IclR family transcriptional regulator [Allobranchiibius]|uniref:IclR family acetate operon transcriptional repressor n=1 Tax=Allobranchiibius huperziae TaxID=1874116 RepID=A0A853DHU1_9MICO|nr:MULTISPECIES: IclR family transcriptional regulator [Allobranchiibius]MBO1767338.1 IclR family transcriptional regulator [Allobranchiibius sp. GilTou38]NYJ76247.1 IclR family acetate operon transcriptional repressor [Allobranchiibius huperziae]UIJ35659.1 IclR family transcriptional regulator [Allobranchiibius sp. GilTou73]